jgi:hypothetical protein
MTVQSTTARADYTGNGATTLFTVPFYFILDSDLELILQDSGVYPPTVTTLILDSDYTVSGAGSLSGGSVTLSVAPTSSQRLTILRSVDLDQLTQYVPNDPFPASSHERALDKLTMQVQQLQEIVSRCIKLPASDTDTALLPSAAQRAGCVISFDSNGNVIAVPVSPGGSVATTQNAAGTINGINKIFTFSSATTPKPVVFVGGVFQTPVTDYPTPALVSGSTWSITFTNAPTNGPITILLLA